MLKIWGLDKYWIGSTDVYNDEMMGDIKEDLKAKFPNIRYIDCRNCEIIHYLKNHKEITNYVVIDDKSLIPLGEHFVETDNYINDEQMKRCIQILNKE